MKEFWNDSTKQVIAITTLLSILAIYITFNYFLELSLFAVALAKATLGIFLFWLFDKYILKEIDTIKELKKGNIAYALFMVSIALVIAAAILSS